MSVFSSIANPGATSLKCDNQSVSIEELFGNAGHKSENQKHGGQIGTDLKIKKVKVEIFDLSDKSQVDKYEKLWAELLIKSAKMEVVVDSRKDLVRRADGTSFWMKYVEYVEFGDSDGEE